MNKLPIIESYGQYSSENYGVNTLVVRINNLTLFYSYRTIVAYQDAEDGKAVCENEWGVTTGKHLNWIDGGNKKNRLDYDTFQEKLHKALERHIN